MNQLTCRAPSSDLGVCCGSGDGNGERYRYRDLGTANLAWGNPAERKLQDSEWSSTSTSHCSSHARLGIDMQGCVTEFSGLPKGVKLDGARASAVWLSKLTVIPSRPTVSKPLRRTFRDLDRRVQRAHSSIFPRCQFRLKLFSSSLWCFFFSFRTTEVLYFTCVLFVFLVSLLAPRRTSHLQLSLDIIFLDGNMVGLGS